MIKKILIAIAAIIVVFLVIVAMQPAEYRVVRSGTIAAPPAADAAHPARACGQATAYRLNALLLDAPYCSAHCRRPFGRPLASMTSPLPKRMRVAITRAYLR